MNTGVGPFELAHRRLRTSMAAGALYDLTFAVVNLVAPQAGSWFLEIPLPEQQVYLRLTGLFLLVLALVYMYSHYFFASLTAHATAFFVPFLTASVALGAPPYFAALLFAFLSSLCVSLTHYGGGPSPVYFASGYVSVRQWWTVGFVISLLHVAVWMGIGPFWWRAIGIM